MVTSSNQYVCQVHSLCVVLSKRYFAAHLSRTEHGFASDCIMFNT